MSSRADFQSINERQKDTLIVNLQGVIRQFSTDTIVYEISKIHLVGSKVYKDEETCWIALLPKSRTDYNAGIFDGELAVEVDCETFKVLRVGELT